MPAIKSYGLCAYCKTEVPKNVRSMVAHLGKCSGVKDTKNAKPAEPPLLLLIEDLYTHAYWMLIAVKPKTSPGELEYFLHEIWLECCGHVSQFFIGGYEDIPEFKSVSQMFDEYGAVGYIYDWGSSTELTLRQAGTIDLNIQKRNIQVLFRNKEIIIPCAECGKPAVAHCPNCFDGQGEGSYCKKCLRTHQCMIGEDEDWALPVVNSPRSGVCAYEGAISSEIKKYFPKTTI